MTVLVTLLVALLPGGLLGFLLPPGRFRWAAWASAPALTLGLASVAMGWLPKIGLPHTALAVLLAELILAGVAVVAPRLVARGRVGRAEGGMRGDVAGGAGRAGMARFGLRPGTWSPRRGCWSSTGRTRCGWPRRADLIGIAVPAVVSVGYGWLLLGRLIAPPGWDGMNHGYMTRRILDTGSVTISSACSSGSTDTIASCSFYPLAANVAWAQATEISGGRMSTVLTAWVILVGPLALVASVYACVRAIGGRPVIAACAATAPVFIGPMWTSTITGRVTEQAAPAMAGGIALLLALALRGSHPVRLGLLAGLACAGIAMTHTYDLLFIGVLALGLFLVLRAPLNRRRAGTAVGAIAVGGIAPLLPMFGALLGANGERVSNQPALLGQLGRAVEYWVIDPKRYVLFGYPAPGNRDFQLGVLTIQIGLWITIACLLASPLCLLFRELRWARPWFVAGVIFTAIGIWTSSSDSGPAMLLSGLWYGVRERVRSMIFPVYGLLTVAGAIVIGLGVRWLLARLGARARAVRDSGPPVAVVASVVVLSLGVLATVPSSWRPLRIAIKSRAPVGAFYTGAFEWLAEHTPPGKVVAYDRHREFVSWSYADYGTPLLFGIPPLEGLDPGGNYDQRWAAWGWLVNNEDAPAAGCAVRRFGVEYVVVGRREMPGRWGSHYTRRRIDASDRLSLVHRVGDIRIYQVTEAGRACSTAG